MVHWKTICTFLKKKFGQHYTTEQIAQRWRNHLAYQKKTLYTKPQWEINVRKVLMERFKKYGPKYEKIAAKFKSIDDDTAEKIITFELKRAILFLEKNFLAENKQTFKEITEEQLDYMVDYIQQNYRKNSQPIIHKIYKILQSQTAKQSLTLSHHFQTLHVLQQFRQKIKQYIEKSSNRQRKIVREWNLQEEARLYELYEQHGRPCGIIGKTLTREFGRNKKFKPHYINGKILSLLFRALHKLNNKLIKKKLIEDEDVGYKVTDNVIKPFFCKKNNANFPLIIKFLGLAVKKKLDQEELLQIHKFILKHMGQDKQKYQYPYRSRRQRNDQFRQ